MMKKRPWNSIRINNEFTWRKMTVSNLNGRSLEYLLVKLISDNNPNITISESTMNAQNRDEAKVKIPKKKKKQKPLKIDLEKIKKLIQKAKAREGAADGGIGYLLGE